MIKWQPKIPATEAGLIYCVEPVFTAVLVLFLPAWFSAWGGFDYANERVTWHLLAGGGLITAANVLILLKPLARPPAGGEISAAAPAESRPPRATWRPQDGWRRPAEPAGWDAPR